MSTHIAEIGELNLNQFFGGKRGLCLQFTPPYNMHYAQLSIKEVRKLVDVLQNWLAERELEMGPARLDRLIERGKKALAGDSNDEEHDALAALIRAIEQRIQG